MVVEGSDGVLDDHGAQDDEIVQGARHRGEVFPCQDELLSLFESLVDVIFSMKHADGRYVAVNAAFVRRTGRSSKRDVIGRRADELFQPALAERYAEQDAEVMRTGSPLRDELELIRRENGSLGWYLTTKEPVHDAHTGDALGVVCASRDLRTPGDDGEAVASLAQVVDHVRTHLADRIRVAELAEVAGCSTTQLERRMRRTFGLTPTQYVLRVRVDRAAELLSGTDRKIAEIASETGFYDQADFTHRFARLTNETPAQFRSHVA